VANGDTTAGIAAMGETDWYDVGKLQSLENGLNWVLLQACPAVLNRFVRTLLGKPAVAPNNLVVHLLNGQ